MFHQLIESIPLKQGKSHDAAVKNLLQLYWPVLKANWSYLSLLVFINIKFVPPIVRTLTPFKIPYFQNIDSIFKNDLFPFVVPCPGWQFDRFRLGDIFDQQTTQVTKQIGCR